MLLHGRTVESAGFSMRNWLVQDQANLRNKFRSLVEASFARTAFN